jgi:hypothetical protein
MSVSCASVRAEKPDTPYGKIQYDTPVYRSCSYGSSDNSRIHDVLSASALDRGQAEDLGHISLSPPAPAEVASFLVLHSSLSDSRLARCKELGPSEQDSSATFSQDLSGEPP